MMTIMTSWEIFSLVHQLRSDRSQLCSCGAGTGVAVATTIVGDGLAVGIRPPTNNIGSLPGVVVTPGARVGVGVRRGVGVRLLSVTTTVYLQ